MNQDSRPYRHLNDDGLWPGFAWSGLELGADGALRLMRVPRFEGALPAVLATLPSPAAPAGLAVDEDGSIFFSDPAHAVVHRIEGCFGQLEAAPCMGGQGPGPTQMSQPAGLALSSRRHALYIADSANHRVQLFDTRSLALVEILGGFGRPVSLALDAQGNLYVVDVERRRVDRFNSAGDQDSRFWEMVLASGCVHDPRAVAYEDDLVYLIDGQSGNLCVFSPQGLVDEAQLQIGGADTLAVIDGAVYVGDPQRRRIAVLRPDQARRWRFAGHAAGYDGPVAALAGDRAGGLLVLPGGGMAPLRLAIDGSFRPDGWLWSAALSVDGRPRFWNRLHAAMTLPADSHVMFFTHAGAVNAPPPPPDASGAFPPPWRAVGADVTDFFLSFDPARQPAVWIGAHFSNDRHATPVLSQARLDFDQESYLRHLPEIYREADWAAGAPTVLKADQGNFLLRYVSLFESFFDELEGGIRQLPALLDPHAAPADALPWLASFLALPLPQVQSQDGQRQAIADAYARYARRGTVAALRETLQAEAGVRAWIDEPLQAMGWWAMPAPSTSCLAGEAGKWVDGSDSVLGVNTVLAASEPQGAVVGTTATLDGSQLIAQDDFGTRLFDGAYHFVVRLYASELACAGKLEQVRALIDRDKPAHTLYELCVIETGLRIGYQARLGIDTLLGGEAQPVPLGQAGLVLGGAPRGRLGMNSRVGAGTQL